MKYDPPLPQTQKQISHDKNGHTFITIKNHNSPGTKDNSSSDTLSHTHSNGFKNAAIVKKDHDSISASKVKAYTQFSSHEPASAQSPTFPPGFYVVHKTSMHAPHVEEPSLEHLKVDTFSVHVNIKCKMTGTPDPQLFKFQAVTPTGQIIELIGADQWSSNFTSKEIGSWKVAMYFKGIYLDGCLVDICDPSQVKVRDLNYGIVGKSNTFYVDCAKAGAGILGVDVSREGRPVKTHISPTTPSTYKVTFTPRRPGAYEIDVHFNSAKVREGGVSFLRSDGRQRRAVFYTRVEQHHDYIEVNTSCTWEVDYVTGQPFICHVADSPGISVYAMEGGAIYSSPEMIGSPFLQEIPEIEETSFSRDDLVYKDVFGKPANADELSGGGVGKPASVMKLSESLQGKPPNRADVMSRSVTGNPASFKVEPQESASEVSVAVKGSSETPNAVGITEDSPDGSVNVWGPGIESGIISQFQGTFCVAIKGTRSGDIRVRIVGPKGGFNVTLQKSSHSDKVKVYQCHYEPIERGVYTINIQRRGVHVGKSPFKVLLAHSLRELQIMERDALCRNSASGNDRSGITQRISKYRAPQGVCAEDVIFY